MCPPALDHPADVLNGKEAILCLDSFSPGSPLPKNVIDDINPYQYRPSNLPDGIWFIVHSTEEKKNDFGFWEVKEQASEIFTNSSISGWRTTLVFVELTDSLEQRITNWVMEEYRITQKGECPTNKEKELKTMCRAFLRSSNKEMCTNSKGAVTDGRDCVHSVPSIALNVDNLSRKGSPSGSLMKNAVDGTTFLSAADNLLDHWRDISEHHVSSGDYLELDDLADPIADECFNSIAFLQDLEDNNSQEQEGKDSSSRFSVTASVEPIEVVMQPAASGSLGSSVIETKFLDGRIANPTVKRLEAEQRDPGPSCSPNVVASTSATMPIPNGKKEAPVVKTKGLKKYSRFMPF